MKVLAIQIPEDCTSQSLAREILLDEPISPEFIRGLKQLGELDYFPTFARPFFHFRFENRIHLKGIEGTRRMVAILDSNDPEEAMVRVGELIAGHPCPGGSQKPAGVSPA